MEILTIATGLIVGVLGVSVDLGGVPSAQLRLDGVPVCRFEPARTTCRIDLGPELAVHELTLLRLDEDGKVHERVSRWLNRPGSAEAEVRITPGAVESGGSCSAKFTWVHPDGARPSSWSVSLDGKSLGGELGKPVTFSVPKDARAHLLSAEATFPDGRRASTTRILGGDRADEGGDSLHAVPIEMVDAKASVVPADLSKRLGGIRVRTLEKGDSEIVFVVDPTATARLGELRRAALVSSFPGISFTRLKSALAQPGAMRLVHPEASAVRFVTASPAASGAARAEALLNGDPSFPSGRLRIADSVAAAGLLAGGGQRRRALVLILGTQRPDLSQFSVTQVRRYLSELLVPLHVIRVAVDSHDDGWGEGTSVADENGLRNALNRINESLDRQRIVWIEGDVGPGSLHAEGAGPRLAGRSELGSR